MALQNPNVIEDSIYMLRTRWGTMSALFEHFIEFTVNSLIEYFNRLRLAELVLVRICEGLENTAIGLLGSQVTYQIAAQRIAILQS